MDAANTSAPQRLIRKPEVKRRLGFKADSTLYDGMAAGWVPRPVKIGPRAVAWVESEIDALIATRIAVRDSTHQ